MVMWTVLAFISALCLGFYDVSKKIALKENAVNDVLSSPIQSGTKEERHFCRLRLTTEYILLCECVSIHTTRRQRICCIQMVRHVE